MRALDLFSGIGGFALAGKRVWGEDYEVAAFCEIDKFCHKVLRKNFGDVPIYEDIKQFRVTAHPDNGGLTGTIRETLSERQRETVSDTELSGGNIRRSSVYRQGETKRIIDLTGIDLLTGGFPCQPFSVAGKRKGNEDDRALWPEMLRIIQEVKPRWIIGENVAGFVNMALDQSISDLENEGYEVRAFIIPACAVNAPHRRDRVWIVGHSESGGRKRTFGAVSSRQNTDGNRSDTNARNPQSGSDRINTPEHEGGQDHTGRFEQVDTNFVSEGLQGFRKSGNANKNRSQYDQQLINGLCGSWNESWYEVATRFCRVDDGVPNRVDRLKSLGNAIVPQVVYEIMKAIKEND